MPEYTESCRFFLKPDLPDSQEELAEMRQRHNPSEKPVGDFTGRCRHCGSDNLWDDNLAYGCNACGAILCTN